MHTISSGTLNHHHLQVSASTNSDLLAALKNNSIDVTQPYMLTASSQTQGRGQHQRTWQSPQGNVYLSLYHPLTTPLSGLLSLVVGYYLTQLPIIQQINHWQQQQGAQLIGVKWANDVGFYDIDAKVNRINTKNTSVTNPPAPLKTTFNTPTAGLETTSRSEHITTGAERITDSENIAIGQDMPLKVDKITFNKLSGILIEPVMSKNRIIGVVIGVGLNVDNAPTLTHSTKEGMDYQAISLNQILGTLGHPSVEAKDLYDPIGFTILRALDHYHLLTVDPYSIHQFRNDYAAMDVLIGRQVIITQRETTLRGIASGINTNGSLRLTNTQDGNKIVDIYTGTISVLATA